MSKNVFKHLFRTIFALYMYFVLYYLSFRINIQPEPCGSSHLSDADESVVPPRSRVDCMDCVVSARGRSTFSCREGQRMQILQAKVLQIGFGFQTFCKVKKPGTCMIPSTNMSCVSVAGASGVASVGASAASSFGSVASAFGLKEKNVVSRCLRQFILYVHVPWVQCISTSWKHHRACLEKLSFDLCSMPILKTKLQRTTHSKKS